MFTDRRIIRSKWVSYSTVAFLHISTLYARAWHPPRVRIDIADSLLSVVARISVQDHSNASEPLSKSHLYNTLRYDMQTIDVRSETDSFCLPRKIEAKFVYELD